MKNIKDYIKVDPTSPTGLRWIKRASSQRAPGDQAGSRLKTGHWQIKFNGKQLLCHRLVMQLSGHDQPSINHEVDHINGVRSDNRIENLRWVTRSRNCNNTEVSNKTGYRWVYKNNNCSTYYYSVWDGTKRHCKSGFATPEEAHAAALAKRKELGLPIDTRLTTVKP